MIVPKIREDFHQLLAAVDGAQKCCVHQLVGGFAVPIPIGVIVGVVWIAGNMIRVKLFMRFMQGFKCGGVVAGFEFAVVN